MLFSSWLRNWKRSAPAARRRKQTSVRQRASFRPRLEALENRLVPSTAIVQTNLVSDNTQANPAQVQDPNLVNPWGLAASPSGAWWVANEGTGTSTLYNTSTSPPTVESKVVTIPPNTDPNSFPVHNSPTGIVYNPTAATGGFNSSQFLFDTLDGTISGWSSGSNATIMVKNDSAVYTGLAIATAPHGETLLYAADFANGKIDVYDQNLQLVTNLPGNFTDSQLPSNYHPFNIQAIGNKLYVEYAPVDKVLAGTADAGDGAVDVYNANGQLQKRLILPGDTHLDDPWAVAMAPGNFGSFSNDLLVGDFGDGHIEAFNPHNGRFVGELTAANGQPVAITHLWGLAFGNGGAAGPTNTLYFTAGLTSHLAPSSAPFHGLFGSLTVAPGHKHGPHGHTWSMPTSTTSSPDGTREQQIDAIFSSSSDRTATLPADDTFTASDAGVHADAGVHTFVNAVFLPKKGKQTLEGTDTQTSALTATDSVSVV